MFVQAHHARVIGGGSTGTGRVALRRFQAIATVCSFVTACGFGTSTPTQAPVPAATSVSASPRSGGTPAHGGIRDQSPAWSPDGLSIVFTTNPSGGGQLWTVKVDGSAAPMQLVPPAATHAAWSPDGRRMAFTSIRGSNWDIYVKELIDGSERRVTTHAGPDYAPAWSPDGSRLAFYRFDETSKRGSIMSARADGSGDEIVLAAVGNEGMPKWSPDGSRIAFQSHRDGNWEIYVMRADGSGQTRLTVTPDRHEGEPAWTPDGKRIVFSAGEGTRRDIYAIGADGSDERRLTQLQRELWGPQVSPDGRRIAFFDFPPGRIYVAGADGSGVTTFFRYR